jgi:3',5'-cyclic AMP phosphodiesterase CpdA
LRIADLGLRIGKLIGAFLIVCGLSTVVFAAQDQQIGQKLAALEKINGAFSFIVVGDNRTGDDIYKQVVSLMMERKPDFIVNTGDMIATPGHTEQWAKFWEMSKPITAPYFLTVGNHDAHPKVLFSEKTYKAQVDLPGNELYYSFVAGNSLFVVLDSYIDDQEKKITGEQLAWLEGVLGKAVQKHKFVFLHHPLFTEPGKGHHSGDSLDKYPKERDRLEALFVKSKVDAIFAGHEHFYQRKTVDGITHVITGGGGAPMYLKDEEGGFYHFVRVVVDGDKVSAEVVDVNGKVRDKF